MASGTVYIDATVEARDGKIVRFGRLLMGNNATYNAVDFDLRTIRNFIAIPWFRGPARFVPGSGALRRVVLTTGSIGSLGVLSAPPGGSGTPSPSGAYVRVRNYLLSGTGVSAVYGGTFRLGTLAGSFRASYMVVGE